MELSANQLLRKIRKNKATQIGISIIICVVLVAMFAPLISPHDPFEQNLRSRLDPPSWEHFFGTDSYGRDIFSRVLYGAKISLLAGLVTVSIGIGFGLPVGLISGFGGGYLDEILMRAIDVLMAFPSILLAIVVVTLLGPGLFNAMIAIGIGSVPTYARLVRGPTLSLREKEFVMAAKSVGVSTPMILLRHILPNLLAPILVVSTLRIARAIILASTFGFLGLGAQPPTADWGVMLSSGRTYMLVAWWVSAFPGIAILITVLGFNLLGDGLRDVFDPKMVE